MTGKASSKTASLPEPIWSLSGLMQSLRAQGKEEQAVLVEKRSRKAWSQADVTLIASRFMGEARTAMATPGTTVSAVLR